MKTLGNLTKITFISVVIDTYYRLRFFGVVAKISGER